MMEHGVKKRKFVQGIKINMKFLLTSRLHNNKCKNIKMDNKFIKNNNKIKMKKYKIIFN